MTYNVFEALNEIESIATRHKRASNLKMYLITDLEMIEKRVEELRDRTKTKMDMILFQDNVVKELSKIQSESGTNELMLNLQAQSNDFYVCFIYQIALEELFSSSFLV